MSVRVEHHVAVREHHAFGHARRTGSIHNTGAFVRTDGLFVFFHYRAEFIFVLASQLIELGEAHYIVGVVEQDEFNVAVDFSGDRRHALVERRRADGNQLGVRMRENMQVIVFAQCTIDWHVDHVGQVDTHVEEVPFRPVVGDGDDLGAGFVAQGQQAIGNGVRDLIVLVNAVLDPFATRTARQDVIFRRIGFQVFEQVEST